ncbi:GPR endopeptidase [Sporolactobacillus sp. THM7-7]|nr:GPR endopeptidase [Sporolactobacillus sp. THM7-7]
MSPLTEQKLDLSAYAVRTDLAIESAGRQDAGVSVQEKEENGIKITRTRIEPQASAQIHKKAGDYLTFEARDLRSGDTETEEKIEKAFARHFAGFLNDLNISAEGTCLVVGLGNRQVTPDALGPAVVENLLVTKHLFDLQPENVKNGYRPVSAITPGVMGLTGIETGDIIMGVIEKTKPDFIIAVDALASRSIDRVNTTIQVSDSGIHPGSGVGNNRKELSKETLGIPVIAIGVPTVVDAVTITSDVLDLLMKHLGQEMQSDRPSRSLVPSWLPYGKKVNYNEIELPGKEKRAAFLGLVGTLPENEKAQLIREALGASGTDLMVTPKDIDFFIEKMGHLLGEGLNSALHGKVSQENVGHFTH